MRSEYLFIQIDIGQGTQWKSKYNQSNKSALSLQLKITVKSLIMITC